MPWSSRQAGDKKIIFNLPLAVFKSDNYWQSYDNLSMHNWKFKQKYFIQLLLRGFGDCIPILVTRNYAEVANMATASKFLTPSLAKTSVTDFDTM